MGTLPDGEECYFPRLEMVMRDIPDKYHEFLWEVTGGGHSPQTVRAAVAYVEGEGTQEYIEERYGVGTFTISKMARRLIEEDVVDIEETGIHPGSVDGEEPPEDEDTETLSFKVEACPECNSGVINRRMTKEPKYRCKNGHEFEEPYIRDAIDRYSTKDSDQ